MLFFIIIIIIIYYYIITLLLLCVCSSYLVQKDFVNTSNINCIMIACNLFPMSLRRIYLMKNGQILRTNCMASMTLCFVAAKIRVRYIKLNFKRTRQTSRSKSRSRNQDVSNMAFYRRRIPNCSFTSYNVCFTNLNMLWFSFSGLFSKLYIFVLFLSYVKCAEIL